MGLFFARISSTFDLIEKEIGSRTDRERDRESVRYVDGQAESLLHT